MNCILVIVLTELFNILVSGVVRWVVRMMHLGGVYERVLRWLELKTFRRPKDALTEKEIEDLKIIGAVDGKIIADPVRARLRKGLAHWGLVKRQWDRDLDTPLRLECKKFFVYLESILKELVVPVLNKEYDGQNIVCFAILPFPRKRKSRLTEAFEQTLQECLGSQAIHREFVSYGMLAGKITPEVLGKVRQGEKIVVLQPMALDDHYLNDTLKLIEGCCMGGVHEVITILDGTRRSIEKRTQSPPERVLIKLNLVSYNKQ